MIKGVNRQVIEVTDTGSPYFERALLVVRVGQAAYDDGQLREDARRLVNRSGGYSGMKHARRMRWLRQSLWLLAGSAGTLLTLLLAGKI